MYSKSFDRIDVILDRVDLTLFRAAGDFDVIEEAFVYNFIPDLKFCIGKKCQPGCPGTSVKVDKDIEFFSSDMMDKIKKVLRVLFFLDNYNVVQKRIPLNELSVRFLYQVG